MKHILALILVFALCVSVFLFSAGAALAPAMIGDMNYDHAVNILDATLIQRALAGITQISDYFWAVADYDRDGDASSIDVTWIQRKEAMMDVPEGCGGDADPNITVHTFFADYDSGKAAVGVPVTFTADAGYYWAESVYTYEFFVDGVMVQSRSQKNSFTYTFTESGCHQVNVAAYNPDGFCDRASYSDYYFNNDRCGFEVVDSYPYGQLELISVGLMNYMFGNPSVKVRASGGTAPYTYSFRIPDMSDGYDYWGSDVEHYNAFVEKYGDYGWKLLHDDENGYYLYQDFSSNDTVYIPLGMFSPRSGHDIYIQAKDAEGNLTEERSVYFDEEILIG